MNQGPCPQALLEDNLRNPIGHAGKKLIGLRRKKLHLSIPDKQNHELFLYKWWEVPTALSCSNESIQESGAY